ncbi:MAG: response regulator, partial [Acidobacteria bacterium]|nr:response regulator [Acidobacteriota bacterium]
AKVLLAEGRNEEAESIARSAVRALEEGGEQSLLAEALTTHGITLARTGRHVHARLTLGRAVVVAEQAGDLENAGQAALTILEELGGHSAPGELQVTYERAAELLANSQHPGVKDRLLACARNLIHLHVSRPASAPDAGFSVSTDWEGFSFRDEMRRYERFVIERALRDAGGSVSRAAQLLGFKHHYSLSSLINKRHKNLLQARSPVVPRKRSIIRGDYASQRAPVKASRPVTILHVEDNGVVANAVKDTLELEGWRVEVCADGAAGLKKVAGNSPYDLLLFDNDLPGVNGLELVRTARKLSHRRRTPIIMLSAGDCETEAWRAGVDAFLHKPEDVLAVADTVARLLNTGDEEY